MRPMFPAKGKWLAWRSAGYEINTILEPLKINCPHIPFDWLGPVANQSNAVATIFSDRIAAPAIPLHDRFGFKSGAANAHS
jgi:hypothetical protein